MADIPGWEALAGLAFLVVAVVPLGLVLLRGLERFVGHRWSLRPLERVIVAFYASGGLLFLLASIPLPVFYPWVVVACFALGAAAYIAVSLAERAAGVRHFVTWLRTPPALIVLVGSVGLLALYVWTIGTLTLGNGLDGAFHSLVTSLLLQNHTAPWTLVPFEPAGTEYPIGAPTWEAVPVILYGWPVVASPVLLPGLFLSFTPGAAYCWGERAGGLATPVGSRMGLLFAGFFGLLASWPRLSVGGSYDFAFALPMFLLTLGWLPNLKKFSLRPWRDVVAVGLLVGVTAVVSGMIGLELVLLIGATWATQVVPNPRLFGRVVLRFAAVLAIGVGFLARSFLGFAIWFGYPGSVLSATGASPAFSGGGPTLPPYRFVTGELDPFVLEKYKLSPIPLVSLELLALLAVGLVLLVLWGLQPDGRLRRLLPTALVHTVVLGAVVTFATESCLIAIGYVNGPLSPIQSITYLEETSFLLFIFYEAIALLPLVASLSYLEQNRASLASAPPEVAPPSEHGVRARRPRSRRPGPVPWVAVLALLVLVQPLALGAVTSGTSVPGFLNSQVDQFANVSNADVSALEWAGAHLPSCARVLVAPGSVARYLPEYASVHLLSTEAYQWNRSYHGAVTDLSDGVYTASTRADLLQITVTDVFVTGQTSVTFPPFQPGPLESSPDFVLLHQENDAYIFSFGAGAAAAACPNA